MAQRLGSSPKFTQAIAALSRLREQYGLSDDLKAIAALLLLVEPMEAPENLFPFVGDANDPRDQMVVQAYKSEWERVFSGEDDWDD